MALSVGPAALSSPKGCGGVPACWRLTSMCWRLTRPRHGARANTPAPRANTTTPRANTPEMPRGRPAGGRTPSLVVALLLIQVGEQPQDLQVQPDQGGHQAERRVPGPLRRHAAAD